MSHHPASWRHASLHEASCAGPRVTRRAALGGLGAALTLARFRPARAAVTFPQRLVIINMRGGLDGLSAVVPYGDPSLAALRASIMPPAVGQTGGMLDLGGFYGLNPALPNLYALYTAGQMLAVHAVGNILATRSHFADQTALQAGDTASASTGWMNRLLTLLPVAAGGVESGIVLGPNVPTIAQGSVQTASWSPSRFNTTPNTLAALVETLGVNDPLIGDPIQSGFNDRAILQQWLSGRAPTNSALQQSMQAAGTFLACPGGPAVALVEVDDLDTHTNQVTRLGAALSDLDTAIGALATSAGAAWANTVVMTLTEFGRTAYVNGCGGTDHGTGLAMFLAGGAVAGGRVIATWPGLTAAQLYQGRDLAPTTDIRSVIMGVLRDHMGLSASGLATVFPNATGISPMGGLVTG